MADGVLKKGVDSGALTVYLEILPDKSARSAKGFLKQLIKKAPVRMKTRQGNFSRDYIIRQSILNRPDATDPCPLSQWSGLRIVSILILP